MDARAKKLWDRGIAHFRQGSLAAAQANFESFLQREPGLAGPALFRLSLIHARRGLYRTAVAVALEALEAGPDQVEVLGHLARCHLMNGDPEAARAVATRALALPRTNPVVLDSLGVVMTRLDEQVLAMELFDQAIALEPRQPSMYFNRALAQKQFGQREGARRDFESCLAMNPAHCKSHWNLSAIQTQTAENNHVERLQHRLTMVGPATMDEELIALALCKELDDLGDYPAARQPLLRGIHSRRKRWQQPAGQQRDVMETLARNCDARFLQPPPVVASGTWPLFVVGMPRSGVTLLGYLLSRHPRVHHLGAQQAFSRHLWRELERDPAPSFDVPTIAQACAIDFEQLGRRYLDAVVPAAGTQSLVCESQPMNFQLCGFIAHALPSARILHVTRDPLDNCVSILGHAGGEPTLPGHDPSQLAEYHGQYQALMQHWHEVLPGRIMEVSYESLVENPGMVLRVVCAFLGIRYGSALRMGLQLNSNSIGRGQRYASVLPPLESRLAARSQA